MIKKNRIKLKGFWAILALFLLSGTPLYSQQQLIKITGQVVDESGEALVGVSVRVKDQRTGTVTDTDGNYRLQASPSSTLIFSYIGYINQEVAVNPSGIMNITMAGEQQLNEVVVVGYGSMKKKDVTGGLSVVGKEQLEMVSTNNLMDRLVGQVAGFSITTTNAAPGQDQTLLIRGENSLSA